MAILRAALLLLGIRLLVCGSAMEHSGGGISGWASNPNYSTTSVSGEILFRTGFALGRKYAVVMGAGAIVLVCSSVIAYMCIGLSRKRKPPDEPVKKDIILEVEPVKHIEKKDIILENSDTLFSIPVPEDNDGLLFRTNNTSDTLFSIPVNAINSYSYPHAISEENGEPVFRSNEKSESLLGPSVPIDVIRSFGSHDHAASAALEEKDDPLFRTDGKSDTPLNTGVRESGHPIDKQQVIPIKIPRILHKVMDKAIDRVVAIGVDKVMDKVMEEMHSGARKMKEGMESGVHKVIGSEKKK